MAQFKQIHTQTGFASMALPAATQANPGVGLLSATLLDGHADIEIMLAWTIAAGAIFTPGDDVGYFALSFWEACSCSDGNTVYTQAETLVGLTGYTPVIVDGVSRAGVIRGVAVHNIIKPSAVAVLGFNLYARGVK